MNPDKQAVRQRWTTPQVNDVEGTAGDAAYSTAGNTDGLGSPNPTS